MSHVEIRVDSQKLFPRVEESITRGHRFKVRGARFKGDVRGRFFTQRVVGASNSLPGEVVEADTVVTFKGRLDKYMNEMGIAGYGPWKGRGFLVQLGGMVGAGLEGRRACSCAVIFFVLCSLFVVFQSAGTSLESREF